MLFLLSSQLDNSAIVELASAIAFVGQLWDPFWPPSDPSWQSFAYFCWSILTILMHILVNFGIHGRIWASHRWVVIEIHKCSLFMGSILAIWGQISLHIIAFDSNFICFRAIVALHESICAPVVPSWCPFGEYIWARRGYMLTPWVPHDNIDPYFI